MPLPTNSPGDGSTSAEGARGLPLPAQQHSSARGLPVGTAVPQGKDYLVYDLEAPPLGYWGDRALATLIDACILFTPLTIAILLGASASPDVSRMNLFFVFAFGVLLTGAVWAGQSWLEGTKGQTLGKKILGLVTLRKVDGLTIGYNAAVRRNFVKLFLDTMSLFSGMKGIREEKGSRQSQADLAVNSVVVYDQRRADKEAIEAKYKERELEKV